MYMIWSPYVRMLFVDFSSAFNTTIPSRLVTDSGLSKPICLWIKDFLSNRQTVRPGPHLSTPHHTQHRLPHRAVCGAPLLYTLYIHDCAPSHSTNTIVF